MCGTFISTKEMNVFVVTCFTFVLMLCHQTLSFNVNEGERAEIEFQYENILDADIHLKKAQGEAFYKEGKLVTEVLTENQQKRFSVRRSNRKQGNVDILVILLQIDKVTREDAGTYVCEVYIDEQISSQDTRKTTLRVDFPPGNAFCTPDRYAFFLDPEEIWTLLSCSALLGSQAVYIQCYQNGQVVPPFEEQSQNTTHFAQKVWILHGMPAFCCSFAYDNHIDKCNCSDFVWNPKELKIFPCPDIEIYNPVIGESTFTQDAKETSETTRETLTVVMNNHCNIFLVYVIVALSSLSLLLLFTVWKIAPTKLVDPGKGEKNKPLLPQTHDEISDTSSC